MAEKIMDIAAVPSYLVTTLKVSKVKVSGTDRVITIEAIEESDTEKVYSCPFLGIAADSSLTVDTFLEWKREERKKENDEALRA
jgi:hypothetical protein